MQRTALVGRRTLLGGLAISLSQAMMPSTALALLSQVRSRVIIDNDFSGDPDGLFQLAHHLLSPSVQVPLIVGSHIHPNDFLDRSIVQADNAVGRVRELMICLRLPAEPPVLAGRNQAPAKGDAPQCTPAVKAIIAEAMRTDTKLPLYYVAGAGLTELAEAVRIEPKIAKKIILIWIGGPEHDGIDPAIHVVKSKEYNLTIDLSAAQTLFNESDIQIWQVPRNVYRTFIVSHAEIRRELEAAGKLGRYLLDQLQRAITSIEMKLGETYILGDSPLVTLTALQSSFDTDTESSKFVWLPTPHINDAAQYVPNPRGRQMRLFNEVDMRLTFADMWAKFRTGHAA